MQPFVLFISCLFLMTSSLHAKTNPCAQHQCIAVIDAGSTGSRLHIFSYDLDTTQTPVSIHEVWSKKTKPAFASLEANQEAVSTYLTALFTEAPALNIPVYFYATAGMRLVPQAKQKVYYQNLKNWFNQNKNWQLMDAKTITGEEEALYDWLAVNYQLGTLKKDIQHAVGVLDIGGASTQIAFPLKSNAALPASQVKLNLYGQQVNLFLYSFLGLGQNEMTHQLLDTSSCFAQNYPLPDGKAGQGDAVECVQEISALINGVHKTNTIIQPILASNPVSTWYAIGGIANIAENKPFQFNNNQLTTQDFLQQADNLACHQQWDDLNNQFPNNEFVDAYCLLPAFYYALMVDGYGFSATQAIHYLPAAQGLDWTMGVVLHH